MKPMLCHRWGDHRNRVVFPWYAQPKLNGIRLIYKSGVMQSRSYGLAEPRTWPAHRLRHLREELAKFPDNLLIDGEIYVHGWSLQKINGAASINGGSDSERSLLLEYHIFDIVPMDDFEMPFSERAELLYLFKLRVAPPLYVVETTLVSSEIAADGVYAAWKALGYEGAVYKDPVEGYGFAEYCGNKENRWKKTLKRKDYLDEKCRIVGVIEGEGKNEGMVGSLILELPNGTKFKAGSGLYDSQREEYWENPPLGSYAEIKYFGLSDAGIPLQPTIEAVLD